MKPFLLLPLLAGLSLARSLLAQAPEAQYLEAAKQAFADKDYGKAEGFYNEAIQANPASAAAWQGLGNCEYMQGNQTAALGDYEQSLAANPNNPPLAAFVQKLRKTVPAPTPTPVSTPAPHRRSGGSSFEYRGPEYDLSVGPAFGFGGTGVGIDETYYFMNGGMAALGFAGNVYLFGLNSPNLTYCGEVLLQLRLTFGDGAARPYLLAGGGYNAIYSTNAFSNAGSDETFSFVSDPMVVAGGGVLFSMSEYFRLFLQAKASIVFGSGTTTTVNEEGYTQTVVGGTLVYVPVQLGMAVYF